MRRNNWVYISKQREKKKSIELAASRGTSAWWPSTPRARTNSPWAPGSALKARFSRIGQRAGALGAQLLARTRHTGPALCCRPGADAYIFFPRFFVYGNDISKITKSENENVSRKCIANVAEIVTQELDMLFVSMIMREYLEGPFSKRRALHKGKWKYVSHFVGWGIKWIYVQLC